MRKKQQEEKDREKRKEKEEEVQRVYIAVMSDGSSERGLTGAQ